MTPTPTPQELDLAYQCGMLPSLRQALYQLMSGQQRSEVRDGDRLTTWHQGNVKELRAEIRKLEIICDPCQRRAVRAGPRFPFGFNSFFRGF